MKLSAITFFVLLFSLVANAQNEQFNKGQTDLQFGIGFLSTLNHVFKDAGYNTKQIVLPVSAALDYAVTDELSAGVTMAYSKAHLDYQGMDLGTVSHLIMGLRGLFHFHILSSLDTYSGAMLGYNNAQLSDDANKEKVSGFAYTFLVGGNYHFAKGAGIYLELGYGVASVNLGLNLKLTK